MSDFSRLEQSFALEAEVPAALAGRFPGEEPSPTELRAEEVSFTQLRGPREITRVLHLREQIALPASTADDPGFAAREKKETSRASWAPSCATVSA